SYLTGRSRTSRRFFDGPHGRPPAAAITRFTSILITASGPVTARWFRSDRPPHFSSAAAYSPSRRISGSRSRRAIDAMFFPKFFAEPWKRRSASSRREAIRVDGARRGPTGLHVGVVERVEHGPENIALGAQRGVRGLLFFAGARVLDHPGQRE